MKTIKDLEKELEKIVEKNAKFDNKAGCVVPKPTLKTQQLRQAIVYLKDFNPSEEVVKKQLDKVVSELNILDSRMDEWITTHEQDMSIKGVDTKDSRQSEAYYKKIHNVPTKKDQVKMLSLILY